MSTILRTSRSPAIPSLLWRTAEAVVPRFTVVVVLVDVIAMAAAMGFGLLLPAGAIGFTSDETIHLIPPPGIGTEALALILMWVAMAGIAGAYSTRRAAALRRQCSRLAVATGLLVGTLSLLALLLQLPTTTSVLLVTPALGLLFLLLGRVASTGVLRRLRSRGHLLHHAVTLSPDMLTEELLTRLHRHPEVGVELVGSVPAATERGSGARVATPRDAGATGVEDATGRAGARMPDVTHIVHTMESLGADTLVVPAGAPGLDASGLRSIRWELDARNFRMLLVPPLTGVGTERLSLQSGDDLAVLTVRPATYSGPRYVAKRAFDLVASSLGILLLTPLWLVLAALVRLGDGGPVFFVQQRVGSNGTTFPMFKFRTMVPDAEAVLSQLQRDAGRDAGNTVMFKMRHDPRITRAGGFLRRFSLDELPQLFNVWLGHMSLVGPRPCLPGEAALYEEMVNRRFMVRPGITGLWQTSGRSDLSWEDTVRLDLFYVENWTIRRDLLILLRTFKAVTSADGAY